MPLSVTCDCGKRWKFPDKLAGQTLPCPNCKAALMVPALPAPAPAPGCPVCRTQGTDGPRFCPSCGRDVLEGREPLVVNNDLGPADRLRRKRGRKKDAGFLSRPLFDAFGITFTSGVFLAALLVPALVGGVGYGIYSFVQGLAFHGGRTASSWVGLLGSDEGYDHKRATDALKELGEPGVPALVNGLSHKKLQVRQQVLQILGYLGPRAHGAVKALIGVVQNDPDTNLRRSAIEVLGQIGPSASAAVPVLIENLSGSSAWIAHTAAASLGRIGDVQAVPALAQALSAKDTSLRAQAADSLARFGAAAKEAAPALLRALLDEDTSVRVAAADALGAIGPEAPHVVPALARSIRDAEPTVRLAVVKALERIGPPAKEALPALVQALREDDLCLPAAKALGAMGPAAKEALPALAEARKEAEKRAVEQCNRDERAYHSEVIERQFVRRKGRGEERVTLRGPRLVLASRLRSEGQDGLASALERANREWAVQRRRQLHEQIQTIQETFAEATSRIQN